MRFRTTAAAFLTLLSSHALAYDATKASRYASPDMYRPNVDRLIINGAGSTGPIDGMSATPAGGSETRTIAGWLGDVTGALAYVPTLSAKLTLAKWLDVPARPQWWGAACDGATIDTTALQSAVTGSASAGLRLRVTGTCVTARLNVPSAAQIDAVQSGGLKLTGTTGPILLIAPNADNVLISGLTFDWSSIGDANADLPAAAIGQTVGGNGGRVVIENNRFKALSLATSANNHAVMLNGANARIIGNYVEGTAGDTLNVNGGYTVFSNNYVGRSGDGCIAFNNSARGVAVGNILNKCTLGVGVGPMGTSAITDHQQSLIIVGNTIEGANLGVNMGWYAYENREGPINWTIANNVFRNSKQAGVAYDGRALGWVTNGAITGNTFTGTGATDFDGTQGSNASDIRLSNASGVTITGNRLSAPRGATTKRAFYLIGSRNVTATGNSIDGSLDVNANSNTTSANVNRYDFVFDLLESQGANITGNQASNAGMFVKLDMSAAGGVYNTIISDNQALDMNVQGINLQKDGSGFVITNNILRATSWGIYLPSTAADFAITSNIIASVNNQAIAAPGGTSTLTNYVVTNNPHGSGTVPSGMN